MDRQMKFGIFDHIDANGAASAAQYARLTAGRALRGALGCPYYHPDRAPRDRLEHGLIALGVPRHASRKLTSTVKLGALVYLLPLHHPLRLLEEIGMLDQQRSGGRPQLGVGRGGQPAEHSRFGLAEADLAPMFDEALEAVLEAGADRHRKGAQGHPITTCPTSSCASELVRRPHPPFWYGTGSSHRNSGRPALGQAC